MDEANTPIPEAEFRPLYTRLLMFTHNLLHFQSWHAALPTLAGQMAQDFVQQAFHDYYAGIRKWNRSQCPDLFVFLAGAIRSIISNVRIKAHRRLQHLNDTLPTVEAALGPDMSLAAKEEEELQRRFWHYFVAALASPDGEFSDSELLTYVQALQAGLDTSCAIAIATGLTRDRQKELRRKLRCKYWQFRAEEFRQFSLIDHK